MKARIVAVATDEEVVAETRPACREDIALWRRWEKQMPPTAEDAHWRWDEYILLAEGEAQGLMLLELEHRNDRGERDIHGLRLSTAPWNRGRGKQYKGVGTVLLVRVVLLSIEKGHEGRFWLEALPGAEGFYRYLGLTELLEPEPRTGLRQFKLDAHTAKAFLVLAATVFEQSTVRLNEP